MLNFSTMMQVIVYVPQGGSKPAAFRFVGLESVLAESVFNLFFS